MALLIGATPEAAARPQDPSSEAPLVVPRAGGPIALDGRLDDAPWQGALDLGPLKQREPREQTPPSEPTRVLLMLDDHNLYVGVECLDSEPGSIVGTAMARDADLAVDDNVEVLIDTFFDHQNAYYFQINPLGARVDGLIAAQGEPNREWDGIWYARASRTERGWSAELALPFKTLNFTPGQPLWGFNVQRTIKRKQENDRWRAAFQKRRFAQVSEAGAISGFAQTRQGRGLDVRPYAATGANKPSSESPRRGVFDAGLDLVKNLTPGLAATLTVNTDFAETEVDARQINLTRFSLFFPEKRTFFLHNSNLFQTAGQGQRSDQGRGADIVPFFSRSIGLKTNGEPLPIWAGAKLTGKAGAWNVGVIDVHTREDEGFPGSNNLAARISRDLGRQSVLGGILTYGSASGDSRPMAGVDGRYATSRLFGSKNFAIEGAVFKTWLEGRPRDDDGTAAATFRADYNNDPLGLNLSYKIIGTDFDPGLGFVPRRGIRKGSYNIDYFQRPRRWGIRHNHWELLTETIHSPDWGLLNWRIFTAPVNLRTESGEHIELNYIPEYERLEAPFGIRPGIVVPPGGYTMHRYRAELNTATKRRLVLDVSVRWGGFYGGSRVESTASVRSKPNDHISLQLSLSRNDVDLPQGRFHTDVWQLRCDVAFSPDVAWSNFLQYDNVSRIAGLNSRFRFTPKPGNDFFLVVNVGRREDTLLDRWVPAYDRVTTKFQYTWRF